MSDATHTEERILEELTEALGLDLLPPEEREAVVRKIGEVIFEGVMLRTVRVLSDEKKEALTALFEAAGADPDSTEKEQAIQDFFATEVPEFDTYLTAEIEALTHAPQNIFIGGGRE
jgi:hypothetical protein